ncbi:hypothetical protein GCM10022271_07050 [Corallibacter vietnamensis]|uniref:YD repeat-containing protein n=1 Tax=Corallibacter vietnamensis TaxID=904130 RepID=A0ABP7GYU3_9FLAO
MKKLLLSMSVVAIVLFSACSSDDSGSDLPQNNAPSGALVKVEIIHPEENFRTTTTYSFNAEGKVVNAIEEGWSASQYLRAIYTYFYNSNGQIRMLSIMVDGSTEYTEFIYTDGLITSSERHSISGNVSRTVYNYNDDNQLINKHFFNSDNEEYAMSNFSFDVNGNIESRHEERNFGAEIIDYTFEYDTYNNPLKTPFENQEMNKIVGHSFNNITKSIRSDDFLTSEVNIEYTYNEAGYPLTSKEYSNGDLLVEVTYTYQE